MKTLKIPRLLKAAARALPGRQASLEATSSFGSPLMRTGGGNVPEIYIRQHRRARRTIASVILFVVCPTVVSAIYYFLIASDQYVSETQMIVYSKSSGGGLGGGDVLAGLVGLTGSSGKIDEVKMLYSYIQSPEILSKLERQLDLRTKFSDPEIDFVSRLPKQSSQERLLGYYLDHIEVEMDPSSPVIGVRAQAFTPEDAHLILATMVNLSEHALNVALEKSRKDTIDFARTELANAEKRLATAKGDTAAFRKRYEEFDPTSTVQGMGGILMRLQSELVTERAALGSMGSYLQPDSTQIQAQKAKIAALESQLAAEREKLIGSDRALYVDLVRQYEYLVLEEKFAETAYTTALAFLEQSRSDAIRQHSYVVDFVPPTLPTEATRPRRTHSVAVVFVACLVGFGVISLLMAAFREQARL